MAGRTSIALPPEGGRKRNSRGWFFVVVLFGAVCFEGLGRKFLPQVPSALFYFLKDVLLIGGVALLGLRREVKDEARRLIGAWGAVFMASFVFTVAELANPGNSSVFLGVLGLRAYWLWYLAPLLVASLMRGNKAEHQTYLILAMLTMAICAFGAYQFARPAGDAINTYALYEGRETNNVDIVSSTGRVRVSSTFSYLSGFSAFTQILPMVFLALGLRFRGVAKQACLGAALAGAATLPMSGSRGAVVTGGINLLAVVIGAGFLGTKAGRRLAGAGVVAVAASILAIPEAMQGVMDRFGQVSLSSEATGRLQEGWLVLPPVALAQLNYPMVGLGTGTGQNAAATLGVTLGGYYSEGEVGKTLIELGPIGYLLMWCTHLGLAIALLRSARFLRRHGRGAEAGVAVALAVMAVMGKLVFDHVFQALFFFSVGLLLHAVVETRSALASNSAQFQRPNTKRREVVAAKRPMLRVPL